MNEHQDFFGETLEIGDTVLTVFGQPMEVTKDLFEFCKIVKFNEKSVVVDRLKIKRAQYKRKRLPAHKLIKVSESQYTLHALKIKEKA